MRLSGMVFQLPPERWNDVNTDVILPGAHLRLPEEELAAHAMEGMISDFPTQMRNRAILVAGQNFGCGSSREQAPKALRGCGVRLVLAASFGFIFYRNAVNLGLPVLAVPDPKMLERLRTDLEVEVDLTAGTIQAADGLAIQTAPVAPNVLEILCAGGLLSLLEEGGEVLG